MLPPRIALFLALAGALSDDLAPPPPAHLLRRVEARGVQIYRCDGATGTPFTWTLLAPEATLIDPATGKEVGSHAAGPVWRWSDGSTVRGSVLKHSPSPDNSIPWLLLSAESVGTPGLLSAVAFVERSQTHGGAAPASGCDAAHAGATTRIPYTATYSFFTAIAPELP